MIRELFATLRSVPSVPPSDLPRLATESTHAFDLLIDFLRKEETLPHRSINAVTTLMWHLIGTKEIPLLLDPLGGALPSLHFICALRYPPQKDTVWYALPYGFLDLVHTDPLMQCCAVLNMASQGCDYYAHRLDPAQTPGRAQAYEAEFLLALRPLVQNEGLSWTPNAYLRGVLRQYPSGLESLPSQQRSFPPSYSIH